MRRLIIMRHGKSDWNAVYGADHDRPLAKRGIAAADRMGSLLSAGGVIPDLILSSSATRALGTAERVKASAGWAARIDVRTGLYGAGPGDVIEMLRRLDPRTETVMVVGHEPTCSAVTETLTGGNRVTVKTATVVGLDVSDDWRDVGRASGVISYVLQPRMFA